MTTKTLRLSDPIPVRLPVALAASIKAESAATGIPESVIIRRDLLAARSERGLDNYEEHVETTKTLQTKAVGETPTNGHNDTGAPVAGVARNGRTSARPS